MFRSHNEGRSGSLLPQWRTKPQGLSVAEVLVSSTLLLLLSATFAALFSQARTSTEGGGARIEIRAQHRAAQQRFALLLRSAIPPTEVDPALSHPLVGEADQEIHFHAPADLLDPEAPFEPRTPDYPAFRLGLDPTTKLVTVRRLDGTGPTQQIGRGFESLTFRRLDERTVEVVLISTLDVRGAAGSTKRIEETSTATVAALEF